MTSKHDLYVQALCDQIRLYYDSLSTNIKISKHKRTVCEIDVLARKNDFYDIYEVKCSRRITKARHQKKKMLKHVDLNIRNIWLYCGTSSNLILL